MRKNPRHSDIVVDKEKDMKIRVYPIDWGDYWEYKLDRTSRAAAIYLIDKYVESIGEKVVTYTILGEKPGMLDAVILKIFELSGFDEESNIESFLSKMNISNKYFHTLAGTYELFVFRYMGEEMLLKLRTMSVNDKVRLYSALETYHDVNVTKRFKYNVADPIRFPLHFERVPMDQRNPKDQTPPDVEDLNLPDTPPDDIKSLDIGTVIKQNINLSRKKTFEWQDDLEKEKREEASSDTAAMKQDKVSFLIDKKKQEEMQNKQYGSSKGRSY